MSAPDPNRRSLLAVVGLLVAVLVIGVVVVARSLLAPAAPAKATNARDTGAAIEAGLKAADAYVRESKYPGAAAILEKLAEQSPTDQAVRVAYAQALIGLNRHAEAYKQYEAAISISGPPPLKAGQRMEDVPDINGLKRDPLLAHLHFEAGTCASVARMADRAEEHYWMAQVLDPGEARYPLYLAMIHIGKGDEAAGSASLLRALKLNPDLAEGWGTLAELEFKKGQTGLAGQHIETARKLQPDVTRWKMVQARVLNRQGEPAQAALVLQSIPPAEQADKSVLALRAECFGLLQSPADAAMMYENAEKKNPTDRELPYQAALWYERAGSPSLGAEQAQRAAMLGHPDAKELEARLRRLAPGQ